MLLQGGLVLMAVPTLAQRAAKDSIPDHQLQEAQVVATRASERTPMAATTLGKEQIRPDNHGRDLPFLIASTPSVTMSSDAGAGIGYTYLRVRGTDPTRINVTANGIPINDAESNNVFWVNMGDFASNLSSLQIQRGVGTSTNGSGAFGASVNMQTDLLPRTPYFRFDGSAGSYGTHKETASFATGLLGGHWAVNGRLSNIGTDGYIDRASAALNSYFLQAGYIGRKDVVRFVTFNGTERTYHAWDYATREQIRTEGRRYNPSGEYYDEDGNRHYYKDQVDDYHQQHYQLLWNRQLLPVLTLNAALHYTRGKGYYETYKAGSKLYKFGLADDGKSDLVRRKYSEADFYGFVSSLNYKKNGLEAILGLGWNRYDGDHYGRVMWVKNTENVAIDLQPGFKFYDNDAKKRDFNVYGRVNYEFVKGLTGYVDLQYRYVDYKMWGPCDEFNGPGDPVVFDFNNTFSFFNPKAGLFYQINPHHSAYFSYAMANKEPTRNDYEAAVYGPTPRSERLNDFELGYNYRSRKFAAGVNFYYMLYKDQFVLTGEQDSQGEFISANVGDSYRRGVELTAAWTPCEFFEWRANATWSHNRIKDYTVTLYDDPEQAVNLGNTPISYSPDFLLNNSFIVRWKGLRAALTSRYVGQQYLTNSGLKTYTEQAIGYDPDGNVVEQGEGKQVSLMLGDYFVSDLDVSYTFDKLRFAKSLTLGCTIYNLFGEKYEANGAAWATYRSDGKGGVQAFDYNDGAAWQMSQSTYSVQAPTNFLFHLSLAF